jgi:hypothetical protein
MDKESKFIVCIIAVSIAFIVFGMFMMGTGRWQGHSPRLCNSPVTIVHGYSGKSTTTRFKDNIGYCAP